jgi:hypothetical protein
MVALHGLKYAVDTLLLSAANLWVGVAFGRLIDGLFTPVNDEEGEEDNIVLLITDRPRPAGCHGHCRGALQSVLIALVYMYTKKALKTLVNPMWTGSDASYDLLRVNRVQDALLLGYGFLWSSPHLQRRVDRFINQRW